MPKIKIYTATIQAPPASKREIQGLIQEARSELRQADGALRRYWERKLQGLVLQMDNFRKFGGERPDLRTANGKAFSGTAKRQGIKAGAFVDY